MINGIDRYPSFERKLQLLVHQVSKYEQVIQIINTCVKSNPSASITKTLQAVGYQTIRLRNHNQFLLREYVGVTSQPPDNNLCRIMDEMHFCKYLKRASF